MARRANSMQSRVTKTAVPEEIRSRAGVGRIDYAVAFCVVADPVDRRSAERWARAMYESPPAIERLFVWYGWKALTARLGPYPSKDHVLGYWIEANEQDYIRFSGRVGTRPRLQTLVLYTGPSAATLAPCRAVRATRRQVRIAGRSSRSTTRIVRRWLRRPAQTGEVSRSPFGHPQPSAR